MDSNRDDAKKCMAIAAIAMENGDFDKAIKFLSKAQKLFPTKEGSEALERAVRAADGGEDTTNVQRNGTSSAVPSTSGAGVRHRSQGGGVASAPSASAKGEKGSATPEQLEIVRRVRRTSNYYEILEVEKSCTDDDLKRAYRKLSLKVHPDKNKAQGAEEAFKIVSKAFQVLSDDDSRSNYDRYGHEDPQVLQQRRQHRQNQHFYQQGGGGIFDDDAFDPNDIFNAFFGGMQNPNGRVFRAHFGGHHAQAQHRGPRPSPQHTSPGQINLLALLQLIPILAFLLYAVLPGSTPAFRLQPTEGYTAKLHTAAWHVPFYVKSVQEFEKDYPLNSRARQRIEGSINSEYRDTLEQKCYFERMQQAQLYRWGQGEKARSMEMPRCDELRRLQRAY